VLRGACTKLGIIAVFACAGVIPSAASAHPMLDRAVAAYEEANFTSALRTFDVAARNADLSVEELLELFEMRALVHHALGDDASMRADLRKLNAVRPSYELGRLAPPPVRDAFEEVRTENAGANGVELRLNGKSLDGAQWMVAKVLRVPDGLVDHVTLQCSVDQSRRTISQTSRGTKTQLRLPTSGKHEGCAATARTRQGAVLFSTTIDGYALPHLSTSAGAFQMPKYQQLTDAPKAKKKKWPWIVAASVVALGGGIAAGVLISQRSNSTNDAATGPVTVSW
jgi:hypothetical protein